MSRYNADFPFRAAFPPQAMTNVLAEWFSTHGVKQAHIAHPSLHPRISPHKFAHVMFFFNGGVEKQFVQEERFMILSYKHKVAAYDLRPEMSVQAVADKVPSVSRAGNIVAFGLDLTRPQLLPLLRPFVKPFLVYLKLSCGSVVVLAIQSLNVAVN
ncbi:hypothetical protein DFH09DRAFT_1420929 [Mycena vulgaris]|nr:hypothetical protein DFH09DRAFT_1420929 [Mycena vulgaris]